MKSNQKRENVFNRMALTFIGWVAILLLSLQGCTQSDTSNDLLEVAFLFTNDFESAYDPVPAYWREDIKHIGGIAELSTLIEQKRTENPVNFLFDSGDIFTGTLAKLTKGELSFELMMTMEYDAMTIGNHEFEYGWNEFTKQKSRVPFPVLGANLFYKGTDHPYAQPYTIIERSGVRVGIIGIMGQDAGTALIPSNIAGVDVRDPIPVVAEYVDLLREQVDIIVLLTHQGKTAPMQTDDEGRPDIQRDIKADLKLAGSVKGIDVMLAGHSDAGTRAPIVHPDTGTLIMQTYGQGQHLGFLKLMLDPETRGIVSYDGKLLDVVSDQLQPDKKILKKLAHYRSRFPEIYDEVGSLSEILTRRYNEESDLGNVLADVIRHETDTQIGLIPSGALRKDIPAGKVRRVDLMDAFPFKDKIATIEVDGKTLLTILEQGLSLERGILQSSGLTVTYNINKPVGERIIEAKIGDSVLDPDTIYSVGTIEILAKGGDAYSQVKGAESVKIHEKSFSETLERYFQTQGSISRPQSGRFVAIK